MFQRRFTMYFSILLMILFLIPQTGISSSDSGRANGAVELYMYTDSGNDILKSLEPDTSVETTKECADNTQEGDITEISTWEIDLQRELVIDEEQIPFHVWAQNGDGNGGVNPENDITIYIDIMDENTVLASDNTTLETGRDTPVEFTMNLPAFSHTIGSGNTLGFRLSFSWASQTGIPEPPNDLEIIYGSTSYHSSGTISCDFMGFSSESSWVDEDDEIVDIGCRVIDAFGTVDLKNEFEIEIEKDSGDWDADPHFITPDHNEESSYWGLRWIWDYGDNAAESGDYTATITATDIRDEDFTTTVGFNLPEQVEPEYGVSLTTQSETQKKDAPDETVSFTLIVRNDGNERDSFTMRLVDKDDHTAWNPGFSPTTVSNVQAGDTRSVTFSVIIPSSGVNDGDLRTFTIEAESQGDPQESDTQNLIVEVEITYSVYMEVLHEEEDASIVNEAVFKLTVENTGNIEDIYKFSAEEEDSQGNWELKFLGGKIITLDKGESRTIDFSATPPEDAKNTEKVYITVNIESESSEDSHYSLEVVAEVSFEIQVPTTDGILKVRQKETGKLDMPISSNSDERERVVLSAKVDGQVTNWVTFHDEDGTEISTLFIMETGSYADIVIKIKIPEDASVGEHTVVIHATNPDQRISQDYTITLTVDEKEESDDNEMMIIGVAGGLVAAMVVVLVVVVNKGKKKKRDAAAKAEEEEDDEEVEDAEEVEDDEEVDEREIEAAQKRKARKPKPVPPAPQRMAPGRVEPARPAPPRPGAGYPPAPQARRGPYAPPRRPQPRPGYPPRVPPPGMQPPPGIRPRPGRAPPYQPRPQPPTYPGAPGMPPSYPVAPGTVTVIEPEVPAVVTVGPQYSPPATVVVQEPVEIEEEPTGGRFGKKKKKKKGAGKKAKEGKKKGRFGRRKGEEADEISVVDEDIAVVEEAPLAVEEEPVAIEEDYEVEEEEEYEVEEEEGEYEVEEEEEYEVEEEEYEVVEEY